MHITSLDIPDVKLITPTKYGDHRGYFMETFRLDVLTKAMGIQVDFVQDNHSMSADPYTVRGLHYQSPPHAQAKLIRCTRGSVLDVAVDARRGSPSYGQHVKAVLSAENTHQLFIPAGFLHGFVTYEPNTEIQYKCSDYYAPECDGTVLWNDPDLSIDWRIAEGSVILSTKDEAATPFKDFDSPFRVDE